MARGVCAISGANRKFNPNCNKDCIVFVAMPGSQDFSLVEDGAIVDGKEVKLTY